MAWVERRKVNKEQKELLMDQKTARLDRAVISTLSERTRAWSLREDDERGIQTQTTNFRRFS